MAETRSDAQETTTTAPAETHPEAQPSGAKAEPFFVAKTQDDLNKKVGDVRTEGRESGKSERDTELLEKWSEFGIESLDDVEAVLDAQRTIETELEGEQITDLKKQHKVDLKELGEERDRYKAALESLLEKEREGIPEHITEVLDEMPPDKQLSYIAKHREAISAEQKPRSVGRGSSPGAASASGGNGGATEGVFGPSRIRVGYEKRNR